MLLFDFTTCIFAFSTPLSGWGEVRVLLLSTTVIPMRLLQKTLKLPQFFAWSEMDGKTHPGTNEIDPGLDAAIRSTYLCDFPNSASARRKMFVLKVYQTITKETVDKEARVLSLGQY